MTITLKKGGAAASIDPKGAQLTSYFDGVREHIWQADPAFWGKSFPILFPIVGFLKDNKTIYDSQEVTIPKHGFARDSAFSILDRKEDFAVFVLTENEETLVHFPRRFCLTVRYTLEEHGLVIAYTVENRDSRPMHYCFGLHPAINCPALPGEDFEDYRVEFDRPETIDSPQINAGTGVMELTQRTLYCQEEQALPLTYGMFDNDALTLEELHSTSVRLVGPSDTGTALAFSGFTSLGLWTPDHKRAPFLCIEPWVGMNDRSDEDGVFEHKYGVRTLSPAEKDQYSLTIMPVKEG